MLLLDYGMSCEEIAKVLYLDDDTISIRYWYQLYAERPELAGGFWLRCELTAAQQDPLKIWVAPHLVFHRKLHREIARLRAA